MKLSHRVHIVLILLLTLIPVYLYTTNGAPSLHNSSAFRARIIGDGQTVDFTESGQNAITLINGPSTVEPQVVEIMANFSESFTTERTIEIELANGLSFHSAPGMVPNRTLRPDNWTFNAALLLEPFPDVITNATYTQNPLIEQRARATHPQVIAGTLTVNTLINSFQPRAGRLVYTLAPGTSSITISVNVVADWAFMAAMTGGAGRHHPNAVTVRVSETGTTERVATLERYAFTGTVGFRINREGSTSTTAHEAGEQWQSVIQISQTGTGRGGQNAMLGGEGNAGQILLEHFRFSVRVPKEIVAFDSSIGQYSLEVSRNPNSRITSEMLHYDIDSTSDLNNHLVTVTLTQPDLDGQNVVNNRLIISGIVPQNPTPGLYTATAHHGANNSTFNLWTPFNCAEGGRFLTNVATYGIRNIRISEPFNALTSAMTVTSLPQAGGIANISNRPGLAPLAPLGGFRSENQFSNALINQAVRITFPLETLELIGVRAFRLPAGGLLPLGSGDQGVRNIVARTVFMQTDGNGDILTGLNGHALIDGSRTGRTLTIPGPITQINGTQLNSPFVHVNFHNMPGMPGNQLAEDEFIAELYYELHGALRVNANSANAFNNSVSLSFAYYGRMHSTEPLPINVLMPAHVIAGQRDPSNPDGSGIHAIHRNSATSTRRTAATANITLTMGSSNINETTIVGGQTRQNVVITVSLTNHQYNLTPYGVQGYYVYLRSPAGILNIERNSIVATWSGNTYSEAQGNLQIDELTDSTNSKVYRLRLVEPILGRYNSNMASYPSINVRMDISALSTAPQTSILLQDLFMASTISEELTLHVGNNHGRALTSAFHIGDSRTMPGMVVTRPNNAHIVHVIPEPDMQASTAVRQTLHGVSSPWQTYNWATGNTIVNVNPLAEVEYRLSLANRTGVPVDDFYTLIPIPKVGLSADGGSGLLQQSPFEWSLSVAGQPTIGQASGYEVLYSDQYALVAASTNFVPWGVIPAENIRTIMLRNTEEPIPIDAEVELTIQLELDADVDLDEDCGKINAWSAMVHRSILGLLSSYSASDPTAVRLRSSVIEGRVYLDENANGVLDENETGINGVIVRAYDSTDETLIRQTTTNATGSYTIPDLIVEQEVDIVFINPSPTIRRFSVATPPLMVATGHTQATAVGVQARRNLAGSWQYRSVNAGLVPQVTVTYDANGGAFQPSGSTHTTSVFVGAALTAPTEPNRNNYTFGGWYTHITGGAKWDFANNVVPPGGITLYAKWIANEFQVSYSHGARSDATNMPANHNVVHGTTATAGAAPSAPGHTFTNWHEGGANGLGIIAPGSSFTMPARNVTLTAQWEVDQDPPITANTAGSGSIEFQQGTTGLTITNPSGELTPPSAPAPATVQNEYAFPPVAPPSDGNYANWAVSNLSIDVGEQLISSSQETFFSLLDARTDANRLAGIIITNDILSPMYSVAVSVGPFMVGSETALSQFELTLRKQGFSSDTVASPTNINQFTVTLSSTVPSINALQVGTSAGSASATIGGVAAHWSAELLVPGDAVLLPGDATAVMTWTITGQTP